MKTANHGKLLKNNLKTKKSYDKYWNIF